MEHEIPVYYTTTCLFSKFINNLTPTKALNTPQFEQFYDFSLLGARICGNNSFILDGGLVRTLVLCILILLHSLYIYLPNAAKFIGCTEVEKKVIIVWQLLKCFCAHM